MVTFLSVTVRIPDSYTLLCYVQINSRKEKDMIKSMTGFGRAEVIDEEKKVTVEMKSVNHRYLDINMRMPKKLSSFEASIRAVLKEYLQRGKVDLFIAYEDYTQSRVSVKYNREIAGQYLEYLQQMSEEFHLENDIRASRLLGCPEVFTMEEQTVDEKELWSSLEEVLREAARQFVDTRIKEGGHEYREKLENKVAELLQDAQIEESRIAAEVILFADKMCTDEETVRLKSHISHMRDVLEQEEGIGRKLDFIAQEMNREANTILSKANDLETSNLAIDLKTEIEKIREQIQNIE